MIIINKSLLEIIWFFQQKLTISGRRSSIYPEIGSPEL